MENYSAKYANTDILDLIDTHRKYSRIVERAYRKVSNFPLLST